MLTYKPEILPRDLNILPYLVCDKDSCILRADRAIYVVLLFHIPHCTQGGVAYGIGK